MRLLSIFMIAICTLFCYSCREKPLDHAESLKSSKPSKPKKPRTVYAEFIPPEDSSISPKQAKLWNACNKLLDSLTILYADSFKVDDPVAILRYQEDFISAQDLLCAKAGLPGGYREYQYIMLHMNIEKNKEVMKAVNASTF